MVKHLCVGDTIVETIRLVNITCISLFVLIVIVWAIKHVSVMHLRTAAFVRVVNILHIPVLFLGTKFLLRLPNMILPINLFKVVCFKMTLVMKILSTMTRMTMTILMTTLVILFLLFPTLRPLQIMIFLNLMIQCNYLLSWSLNLSFLKSNHLFLLRWLMHLSYLLDLCLNEPLRPVCCLLLFRIRLWIIFLNFQLKPPGLRLWTVVPLWSFHLKIPL